MSNMYFRQHMRNVFPDSSRRRNMGPVLFVLLVQKVYNVISKIHIPTEEAINL